MHPSLALSRRSNQRMRAHVRRMLPRCRGHGVQAGRGPLPQRRRLRRRQPRLSGQARGASCPGLHPCASPLQAVVAVRCLVLQTPERASACTAMHGSNSARVHLVAHSRLTHQHFSTSPPVPEACVGLPRPTAWPRNKAQTACPDRSGLGPYPSPNPSHGRPAAAGRGRRTGRRARRWRARAWPARRRAPA